MLETKKIGLSRETEALRNINSFGFLTSKSIAALTEGVSGESATKSAKRVIKRLLENKEILKRKSIEGILVYVLTEKGAARIKENCFLKRAKTGAELETRLAIRQDKLIEEMIKIKNKKEGKKIELLGEIWLRRYPEKWAKGLHGIVWKVEEKKGTGIYFISSVRTETAEHVIKLSKQIKEYIDEIQLTGLTTETTRALLKKINKK